jgi:hypothetical protein
MTPAQTLAALDRKLQLIANSAATASPVSVAAAQEWMDSHRIAAAVEAWPEVAAIEKAGTILGSMRNIRAALGEPAAENDWGGNGSDLWYDIDGDRVLCVGVDGDLVGYVVEDGEEFPTLDGYEETAA